MDVFAFSILTLADSVDSNIKGFDLKQRIELTDSINLTYKVQSLSSTLRIVDLATVQKTVALSASNSITLSQDQKPRVFDESVIQQLFVWSDINKEDFWPLVSQSIILSQTAEATKAKGAYSTLVLSQSVEVQYSLEKTVTQTIPIVSNTVGYLPSKYWTSFPIGDPP